MYNRVKARLWEIIQQSLGIQEFNPSLSFYELQGDSIDLEYILEEAEIEFGVHLSSFSTQNSPNDLLNAIHNKTGRAA